MTTPPQQEEWDEEKILNHFILGYIKFGSEQTTEFGSLMPNASSEFDKWYEQEKNFISSVRKSLLSKERERVIGELEPICQKIADICVGNEPTEALYDINTANRDLSALIEKLK